MDSKTPAKATLDIKEWAFDRSIEITLNHLAAAREIAIKLNSGHEPNPALLAGLVQAMATNYLAEMQRHIDPQNPPGKLPPPKTHFPFDPMVTGTWPALHDNSHRER